MTDRTQLIRIPSKPKTRNKASWTIFQKTVVWNEWPSNSRNGSLETKLRCFGKLGCKRLNRELFDVHQNIVTAVNWWTGWSGTVNNWFKYQNGCQIIPKRVCRHQPSVRTFSMFRRLFKYECASERSDFEREIVWVIRSHFNAFTEDSRLPRRNETFSWTSFNDILESCEEWVRDNRLFLERALNMVNVMITKQECVCVNSGDPKTFPTWLST